jgi:uncharacterized protein (DUF433 family)
MRNTFSETRALGWQLLEGGIVRRHVLEVFAMATQEIVSDPAVMMGKPVVAGTRITVESVLESLGEGESIEQVLEAHPRLTREGVLAAVRFGAEVLRADVAYPVPKSVA